MKKTTLMVLFGLSLILNVSAQSYKQIDKMFGGDGTKPSSKIMQILRFGIKEMYIHPETYKEYYGYQPRICDGTMLLVRYDILDDYGREKKCLYLWCCDDNGKILANKILDAFSETEFRNKNGY